MPNKMKFKSSIHRKLANAGRKALHDETYSAFKLENQILLAMEDKGWTYSDLAQATHTSKSNVSRDLRAGGLLNASLSRVSRIADALGMKFVALLLPKDFAGSLLPRIERLILSATNSAIGSAIEAPQGTMIIGNAELWNPATDNVPNYWSPKVRRVAGIPEFVGVGR